MIFVSKSSHKQNICKMCVGNLFVLCMASLVVTLTGLTTKSSVARPLSRSLQSTSDALEKHTDKSQLSQSPDGN